MHSYHHLTEGETEVSKQGQTPGEELQSPCSLSDPLGPLEPSLFKPMSPVRLQAQLLRQGLCLLLSPTWPELGTRC